MSNVEQFEILVLGSGEAGKYLAWTMAKAGHRTAMVERKHLGGSCPNIACLPSKNLIYSAKVASLARRGAEFGLEIDSLSVNMASVQRRKRIMVEGLHQLHVDRQAASGAELIMGDARFIAPRTVEVALNDGGTRTIFADNVALAVGSRATMPNVLGLLDAQPMTHVEALDLDRLPEHFLVLNGDILTDLDFGAVLDRHASSGAPLTIATYARQVNVDFGVLEISGDRVIGFHEKPTLSYSVSMGVYGLSRATLATYPANQPLGFDELVLDLLAAERHPVSLPFDGYWLDIGRPDDYDRANLDFVRMRDQLLPTS